MPSDPDPPAHARWFGERWSSPFLADAIECGLPSGVCSYCGEGFEEGDAGWVFSSGQPVHIECGVRVFLGGVFHQLGMCRCAGGSLDADPPGLSLRDGARAAWTLHKQRIR